MNNYQGNINLKDFINVNNIIDNDNNYKNYPFSKEQEIINNIYDSEEMYNNISGSKNKINQNINNNNKMEFDFIQSPAGIKLNNNQLNNLIRNKGNIQNMNNNNKINNNFINNNNNNNINNINNSVKIANRNYKVIDYNNNGAGMIPKNNAFAFNNNKNRGNLNPTKNQCKILFNILFLFNNI
jgi:ATP-dependent RNA helicase DDX3X